MFLVSFSFALKNPHKTTLHPLHPPNDWPICEWVTCILTLLPPIIYLPSSQHKFLTCFSYQLPVKYLIYHVVSSYSYLWIHPPPRRRRTTTNPGQQWQSAFLIQWRDLSGLQSLLALYLGGTPSQMTGTRPPSCKHLDNRLYINWFCSI